VHEAAVVAVVVAVVVVATKSHAKFVARLFTPRYIATRGLMPATMEKRSMPTWPLRATTLTRSDTPIRVPLTMSPQS
jgi:hypothetical protein